MAHPDPKGLPRHTDVRASRICSSLPWLHRSSATCSCSVRRRHWCSARSLAPSGWPRAGGAIAGRTRSFRAWCWRLGRSTGPGDQFRDTSRNWSSWAS